MHFPQKNPQKLVWVQSPQHNTKIKEVVIDYHRITAPVNIQGLDIVLVYRAAV